MRIQDSLSLAGSKPNTRWLRAYLFGYFIAVFIATALDIRSAVLLQLSNMLRPNEFAAMFLPALLCLGTGIVAFLFMKKMTLTGYRWNALHMGCMAFYLASENSIQIVILWADVLLGYAGCMAILLPLFIAIWFYPNYLYFKKRKELFRTYSQNEIEVARRQRPGSSREKLKALLKTRGTNNRWIYLYITVYLPVIAVVCSLGLVFNRLTATALWLAIVQGQALDCLIPLIMLGLRIAQFPLSYVCRIFPRTGTDGILCFYGSVFQRGL